MLKNYIKTSFRNFTRNKSSFLINVTGLSLGLAGSILILLWVIDERSVDKFHPEIDRIYQVMEHQINSEDIFTTIMTPGILAPALKEEIPEFEFVTSYSWNVDHLFRIGDKSLKSTGIYTRPALFHILHFEILAGNPATWLHEPNTVVLSATAARRYFENGDAVGQQLIVNNEEVYTVIGVYDDFPANSSFSPDFIMSFEDLEKKQDWLLGWNTNGPGTLAKLREGADADLVSEKIRNFIREKNETSETSSIDLFLFPYADQYLYGRWQDGQLTGGRIEYLRIFLIVAIMVLLIACINFMNLSTARSAKRAREVGIRKSIGASRESLVAQYLSESVLISFISLVCAVLLVELALPLFNNLTGKEIAVNYLEPSLLLVFAGIALCTGLIAGSYPAFYLSAFEAVKTLKGTLTSSARETFARKGLVVFQFTLSIILIVSTILIYNQVQHVQTKNLGYQKENLISFLLEGEVENWWETFRQQVLEQPGVTDASRSATRFLGRNSNIYGVEWQGKDPNSSTLFEQVRVDYDLAETLGFEMAEGRSFSRDFGADSTKVIVNQAAINVMGMADDPIGRQMRFWGRDWEIIGVVEDFNYQHLSYNVEPLFMVLAPADADVGFVRLETGQIRETLSRIEGIHAQVNPAFPFDYSFMDQQYASLYQSEKRVGELSKYFALFAIFISCLGLFGLSAFTAEQRRKEIGIRKVMGASVHGLVGMLSKDFTRLVLVSMLIAVPVSWWLMERWLADYAYRITIGIWPFALACGGALLIAWLTVSWQSIKAALMNPVNSLRSE